jgi:putative endonuclease
MQVHVYILYSEKLDRYYTGLSTRPDLRLKQHRRGESFWSSRASDWKQVFLQTCMDQKTQALEKQIKAQGAKRFMIRQSNGSTENV